MVFGRCYIKGYMYAYVLIKHRPYDRIGAHVQAAAKIYCKYKGGRSTKFPDCHTKQAKEKCVCMCVGAQEPHVSLFEQYGTYTSAY